MCMIDGAEGSEFGGHVHHKARKPHWCEECGREISCGERYRYASGKACGYFWTSKMCEHCEVAAAWLIKNCRGFVYAGVIEDLQEHAEQQFGMLRLVVGAKRQWRSFADPAKLMPVQPYPRDMI